MAIMNSNSARNSNTSSGPHKEHDVIFGFIQFSAPLEEDICMYFP